MRYRITSTLELHPGALLGLTAEQAAARSFALAAEGGLWRVLRTVCFKVGEEIESAEELPKGMAAAVEPAVERAEQPALAAAPPEALLAAPKKPAAKHTRKA